MSLMSSLTLLSPFLVGNTVQSELCLRYMTHTFPAMRTVLPVVGAVPSGCVGIEELHQHGSQNLRSYLVGLTWKAAMLGMGHRLGKRQGRDVHKGIARRA